MKNKIEKKQQEQCPDHPGSPMRNLDTGEKRCAPISGVKCKFTRGGAR